MAAIAVMAPVSIVRAISFDKIDFVEPNGSPFFARKSCVELRDQTTGDKAYRRRTTVTRVVAIRMSHMALPLIHPWDR
jgi:hypothetical protein